MFNFISIDRVYPITIDVAGDSASGSIPVFYVTDENTSYIKVSIVSHGELINMLDYSYSIYTTSPQGNNDIIELDAESSDSLLIALNSFTEVGDYKFQIYVKDNTNKIRTLAEVKYTVKSAIVYRE